MEKAEKLSKFPQMLSLMRKERGISQKKAATDLGISQALLSHYEKGIRECGLDFVIKCSKYYNVTTDYLLGVSESRNGLGSGFLSQFDDDGTSIKSMFNATKYLLNTAVASTSPENSRFIYDYFTLCVYRGALTLAKAGAIPKELFRLDYSIAKDLATAAIAMHNAKFILIEDKSRAGNAADDIDGSPLKPLIDEAEDYILNNYIG